MSESFSRTLRALQGERTGRFSWIIWLFLVFSAAWLGWLFLARVPLFATADPVIFTSSNQARALLLPSDLAHLVPGQPARIRLDIFPWTDFGEVTAVVESIDTTLQDGYITANLKIEETFPNIPLQPGLTGTARIEIAQAPPITILLRSIGQQTAAFTNGDQKDLTE